MNVIIIEDEKLSAEHLANLLHKIDPTIEVVTTIDSIKKAVEYLQTKPTLDLLFVDIHLADGISFDIFSTLSIETPVIFTTAYNEYAIKAFKVNSIDYLLKPIGIEELKNAVIKFKKLKLSNQNLSNADKFNNAINIINKEKKTRFMVKMGDSISSIKVDDISHFIAEVGIVLLVNKSGKRFAVDYTLDKLEELLDVNKFFRINRKVIINFDSVHKVNSYFNSRYKITSQHILDGEGIVSRERVNDFKIWLDK